MLPVIQGERGRVIPGERERDVKAPPGVAGRGLVFTVSRGRSVSSPVRRTARSGVAPLT